MLVGGTVGVDGNGFHLFPTPDPTLNLACGVWAPRDRIACEGWDDSDPSRTGIYTVGASNGSDPRRLTRHRDVTCEYSADGSRLAFVRTGADDTAGTLMLMDAEGGKSRAVLAGDGLDGYSQGALWSPDGSHILFSMTLEADDFDVYTVATDGSDLNRIIDSDLLEEAANWLA
jgi:Tol biopolymer transport system component